MSTTLRKSEILNIARREGKVTVDRLVELLGVTPQTIRRDLTELSDEGALDRVHGGAVLPSSTANIGYDARRQLNQSAKVDIARACARQIPNDCCIFLNIGTTTEAVAQELLHHKGLLVVTNNINIAVILSANPDVQVIVSGGSLRRSDGGLVGELATDLIRRFRFDISVIGCSALNNAGDMLDFDLHEVSVSHAIMAQSDKVWLAADHSKFERKAPIRIGSMADVDVIFTDQTLPKDCAALCDSSGTKVTRV
ncbi:DeoR/GlpR family DNA-binding transcription regulator [Aliiroseovarius sp. S1123]|uniref:DeoR/GlpR family DNA-binding transcription regulator n=1 Tax=unclassified Aliiroseovarius TaxID=2623558 RepID=UPI001FF20B9F|nr:DeoR/GlpR family DNA-binding transcription regulator [Aliiroseovarius sp. S1123]MCK0170787.1 DeoR/GlpR family DNA-binding transcription regulator [Aliiroseovarius sp. S1123]